jgi:hypothetical protein
MTKEDFVYICNEHTVDPGVAMSDEGVRDILKQKITTVYQDRLQQIQLSTYLNENF